MAKFEGRFQFGDAPTMAIVRTRRRMPVIRASL